MLDNSHIHILLACRVYESLLSESTNYKLSVII